MEGRQAAERWLEVAEKLLRVRDLVGSRGFAIKARESFPSLEGPDQITAVVETLLAAEKRINNHMDWYAILQVDRRSGDVELIKRQFRRLALLLHPDKNKFVYAENAFKLVNDAWVVLSDPSKKSLYDNELNLFLKFDPISFPSQHMQAPQPQPQPQQPQQPQPQRQSQPAAAPVAAPQPVRRSPRERTKANAGAATTQGKGIEQQQQQQQSGSGSGSGTTTSAARAERNMGQSRLLSFWTCCPYCYNMYEYPRVYEECCLRCQNCRRGFHATVVPSPPNVVAGKEAYYCCWAFFPIWFSPGLGFDLGVGGKNSAVPNWVPFTSMSEFQSPQGEMKGKRGGGGGGGGGEGEKDDNGGGGGGGGGGGEGEDEDDDNVENGSDERQSQSQSGNVSGLGRGRTPLVNEAALKGDDGQALRGQDKMQQRRGMKKTVAKRGRKPGRGGGANRGVGGRSNTVWIDMDLNVEIKDDGDEAAAGEGEGGMGSIEEEATEGIGFFEGLDDFLGSLPILNVAAVAPEQQKVQGA
ncbi:hypothetical protein Sjap_017188 [Stephania japonica]|uniref:J domain-containing protein n=1 Tax=Stephania japonica TaxID=461633 RepID=A0AAP0I5S5_9MAGN